MYKSDLVLHNSILNYCILPGSTTFRVTIIPSKQNKQKKNLHVFVNFIPPDKY